MTPGDWPDVFVRPAWHAFAACRGAPTADFFSTTSEEAAKAVCGACEVRPECLAEALRDRDLVGVWGGLNDRERRQERRRLGLDRVVWQECRWCLTPAASLRQSGMCDYCDHLLAAGKEREHRARRRVRRTG